MKLADLFKALAVSALTLFLVTACKTLPPSYTPNASMVDANIYDTVFKQFDASCPTYVESRTKIRFGPLSWSGPILAKMLAADPSAGEAYDDANKIRHPLQWHSKTSIAHMIDVPDLDSQKALTETLQKIHAENSCARRVYSVSAPGVSNDGDEAIVVLIHVCGGMCHGGEALRLRRSMNGWMIVKTQFLFTG